MGPARNYRPRGHSIITNQSLYWTESQLHLTTSANPSKDRGPIGTRTWNLNLSNLTQHILNAGRRFMKGILHDGEPKAIQLVNTCMGDLFQKLDRIITTAAFLLVLILMRKFCQPQ